MSPDQRVKQNRTKWRIIAMREMREMMAGKRLWVGNFRSRAELDLARTAYLAGWRDAERNKS